MTLHDLVPPANGERPETRIYARRWVALVMALASLAFCALGVWTLLDRGQLTLTASPLPSMQAINAIISLAVVMLSGAGALLFLYLAFRRSPLLRLDPTGLRFQYYSWKRVVVGWQDIDAISVIKPPVGFSSTLVVTLWTRRASAIARGFRRNRRIAFPKLLVSAPLEQIVKALGQYKPVVLVRS